MPERTNELIDNFKYTWHEDGFFAVASRLKVHAPAAIQRRIPHKEQPTNNNAMVDVLFVNGCGFEELQCIRYRVLHQVEQLEDAGLTTKVVNHWDFVPENAHDARVIIIYRYAYDERLGQLIDLAHSLGKKVLFDIDDLQIDTKYTDKIPVVWDWPADAKRGYDELVWRKNKTLSKCDGAMTSTPALAAVLAEYKQPVFLNCNVASKEMAELSDKAIEERDILPKLKRWQVSLRDAHRWRLAKKRAAEKRSFSMGYFSGVVEHNYDLALILPALARFMGDYPDVELHLAGKIDIPQELSQFSDRIVFHPFVSWRRLPKLISGVDVNLFPLVDSLFNNCKSANKWLEASLVKVPTVASNSGALAEAITNGFDGLLCATEDEWYEALVKLRADEAYRTYIAQNAYETCQKHYITTGTGAALAAFLKEFMVG